MKNICKSDFMWRAGFAATQFRSHVVYVKRIISDGLSPTLRFKPSSLLVWFALGLATTLAQEDSEQTAQAQETTTPELAAVRLAHVSPDAPRIDLLIDGRLRLRDVGFTELSEYITVPAGEHELRVQPHRAPNDPSSDTPNVQAPEPFIISETLQAGRYYTLVTSGFFDPPPSAEELGVLSLSMTEGITATVVGPRAYATTVTESTDLSELIPGMYTVTASREGFRTTRYEAQVRPNEATLLSITLQANDEGETSEPPEPVVGTPTNNGLEWGKVQLQLYDDQLDSFPPPGTAFVRVIHASPVTPPVSVVLERRRPDQTNTEQEENTQAAPSATSEPAVTGLAYPNAAGYFSVAAGTASFRLQDTESGQSITELENLDLHAGTIYTFFIVGTRDDNFVSVIPVVDAVLAGNP
jgi:hypothetical protein